MHAAGTQLARVPRPARPQHIADVLRLKLAMDAGTPPLSQVALSRGLEELSDKLEDLRAETVQSGARAATPLALGRLEPPWGPGRSAPRRPRRAPPPIPSHRWGMPLTQQQRCVMTGASSVR